MRVAIMQPTWLPWLGYFDLIDQVDRFVFLDTVQFCLQSWHCRNRIRTSAGDRWVSLPVVRPKHLATRIDEVTVNPEHRLRKFIKTLRQEYGSAAGYEAEAPPLIEHLQGIKDGSALADVNIDFIHYAMKRLAIETETVRASAIPAPEGRVSRLIEICKTLGADTYVCAPGSASYIGLEGVETFEEAGISLVFQRYDHPIYPQCGPGFMSFMSIIDLLLNTGSEAASILRSGHRPAHPAREFLKSPWSEQREQENRFGAA